MRDLITHRTGVPRHDFLWYASDKGEKEFRQQLYRRLPFLDASCEFRERSQYSNLMYYIAQMVIEEVTGTAWQQLVETRLFHPLAMDSSHCDIGQMIQSTNYAKPHVVVDGNPQEIELLDVSILGAAGAVNSTAKDMAQWIKLQLEKGGPFVSRESVEELHRLQAASSSYPSNPNFHLYGWGLGCLIGHYRGHYEVSHSGATRGYHSELSLLPQQGLGYYHFI